MQQQIIGCIQYNTILQLAPSEEPKSKEDYEEENDNTYCYFGRKGGAEVQVCCLLAEASGSNC